ncbi:hypothetical protein [Virgisporangium aliadipatigenens]|nr:hypothetical protein [Virgisporangium aliadipatigenens]
MLTLAVLYFASPFLLTVSGFLDRDGARPGIVRLVTFINWFNIVAMTAIAVAIFWAGRLRPIGVVALIVVAANGYLLIARRRAATRRDSGIILPPERRTRRDRS